MFLVLNVGQELSRKKSIIIKVNEKSAAKILWGFLILIVAVYFQQ